MLGTGELSNFANILWTRIRQRERKKNRPA